MERKEETSMVSSCSLVIIKQVTFCSVAQKIFTNTGISYFTFFGQVLLLLLNCIHHTYAMCMCACKWCIMIYIHYWPSNFTWHLNHPRNRNLTSKCLQCLGSCGSKMYSTAFVHTRWRYQEQVLFAVIGMQTYTLTHTQ